MEEAVVAVLRRGERMLVVRRGPRARRPGYWSPVSGRIEAGESQAEAVVREVREEVGLEVRPLGKVWECPTDDGRYRLHWWSVEVTGGELDPEPGEVAEARFVDPSEFLALEPTFEGDREFFERVLPRLPE